MIIYVGRNNILRNKTDTDMNNLCDSILEIANTWQNYIIGYTTIKADQSHYIANHWTLKTLMVQK